MASWKTPNIPAPELSEFVGCTKIPKGDPLLLVQEGCPKVHCAVRGGIRNEHRFKMIESRREIWFLL